MRSALNNVPKYALKSVKHESILSCGISIQRCVSDVVRCTGVCCGGKCHMPATANPQKISWRHTVVSTLLLQSSLRLNCHESTSKDSAEKRIKGYGKIEESERERSFGYFFKMRWKTSQWLWQQRSMISVLNARMDQTYKRCDAKHQQNNN